MNDFLAEFYHYISESIPSLRTDPEYIQAVQAYMTLEAEVKEKIGVDLIERYQQAESQIFFLRDLEVLRRSLRFGVQFALEVLR